MRSLRLSSMVAACTASIVLCGCPGGGKTDAGSGGGTAQGGGTTSMGGGTAGGSSVGGGEGGGSVGGGNGGGGIDAGPIDSGIPDPFNDGGTFVPGDICSKTISIDLTGAMPTEDGGTSVSFVAPISTATHQYTPVCSAGSKGPDLVYKLDLAQAQAVTVTALAQDGGSGDPVLAFIADPCVTGQQVSCNDYGANRDPEVLTDPRLPAGTWYLLVAGYNNDANQSFDVKVELSDPTPASTNDVCASAEMLSFTNDAVTFTADTSGSTNGNPGLQGTICSQQGKSARDIVYAFTTTQTQDVTIATTPTGSTLQPLLYLRSTCDSGAPADEIGCVAGTESATLVRHSLPAGTYFLWVDGRGISFGATDVTITLSAPTMPPDNDMCAMATVLTPGTAATADLTNANADYPLSCAANATGGDAVFQFTLTMDQKVTVSVASPDDAVVAMTQSPCATGTQLSCSDRAGSTEDETVVRSSLPAGTYYVIAKTNAPATGPVSVTLTLDTAIPPPMNDTCATPTMLVPNMSQTVQLEGANKDETLSCAPSAGGGEVYYTFTTTMDQKVTLTATAADPNADVAISLIDSPCATGAERGCRNATTSNDDEKLVVNFLPAGTYFVALQSVNDPAIGDFGLSLALDVAIPPPANDTCATATVLAPNVSQVAVIPAAQHDATLTCGFFAEGGDVYYQFTLTQPQRVTVTATPNDPNDNPVVAIIASPCASGTELSCADNTFDGEDEVATLRNLGPGTYYIVVQNELLDANGTYGVSLTLEPPILPPTNDTCAAPAVVTFTGNAFSATSVPVTDASNDYMGSCGNGLMSAGDVVYQVSVPAGATLTVDVTTPGASDADPVLYIRSPVCTATTDIDCADNGGSNNGETLSVTNSGAAAATYFVIVDEYNPDHTGLVDVAMTLTP